MNQQDSCSVLVEWSYQGARHDMSDELRAHLSVCAPCAAYAESVQLARALGEQLPFVTLEQAKHDALKLELVTESRRWANTSAHRGPRRVRALLWAAAITVGVTTAAAAAFLVVRRPVQLPVSPTQLGATARRPSLEEQALSSEHHPSASATAPPITVVQVVSRERVPPIEPSGEELPARSAEPQTTAAPIATNSDDEFAEAWAALRANRPTEAARRFDALLERASLDPARRVDVLYWSAQAHRRAGNTGAACARSTRLLREFPRSALASNAALLLGEVALEQRQPEQAKSYLERAKNSNHPLVKARAERALKTLNARMPGQ